MRVNRLLRAVLVCMLPVLSGAQGTAKFTATPVWKLPKSAEGIVADHCGLHVACSVPADSGHSSAWVDGKLQPGSYADVVFYSSTFSPDGKRFGYAVGKSRIWGDIAPWSMVLDGQVGPEYDSVGPISFSSDNRHSAYRAWSGDSALVVVDGRPGPAYDGTDSVVFSADGRRVAYRASKGGKSFIVVPATAKNGSISRIVPTLTPGTHVSTSKNDVNYVITEYGVAQLRGKSFKQRARELISIASPDFRGELTQAARKMGLA